MSAASPRGATAAPSTISWWSSLGIAAVAHALIFALLPSFASLSASMRLDPVDLEIISPPPLATPPPEPTPPAPDPVAPPEPTPVVPPPRRVRAPRPETAPEPPPTPTPQTPQPPAPLQETPVRMDGINLTGTGTGSGFAIDPGSGETIGGKSQMINSLEFITPVYEQTVHWVLFADAGNVWADTYDVNPFEMNVGVGTGVRLLLPIGAVSIDYGWPILRDDERLSDKGRLHFTLGYNF